MRAILVDGPGGPEKLTLTDVPDPEIGARDVRIAVAACGVNRADIAQRQGRYPSPAGAPVWPGLEVSGIVSEIGSEVFTFAVGDRVCALLPGGGYAEQAVVHEDMVLPVPDSIELVAAAGLPEALATVWSNVFMHAQLQRGETILVHGGASGIGTTAIQLARLSGARVAVTAGSADKLAACRALGADILINYREDDFPTFLREVTGGEGADVILDIVGGSYAAGNVAALAMDGRIMVIANQSGVPAEFDLMRLMMKRGRIWGTTLRARPQAEKAEILRSLQTNVWPWLDSGEFRPVIDSLFTFEDAAAAHRRMESSLHVGKILLTP